MRRSIVLLTVAALVLGLVGSAAAGPPPGSGPPPGVGPTRVDLCRADGRGSFVLISVPEHAVEAQLARGAGLPGGSVPGLVSRERSSG